MTKVLPDGHTTIPSVLTVTSPLVHSDERVEVMQRFRREPVIVPDGDILDVPIYSGNAIRGMLRRAAALRVVDQIGVADGDLPVKALYLLFSGGYLEGTDYAYRVEDIRDLTRALPLLGLLGCSYGARVLPGRVEVWRGEPVCRELAGLPGHTEHPAYRHGPVHSVYDLLTEVAYTRHDDRASELGTGEKSPVQMRYSYEALIPGTRLLHGLVLQSTDPLLRGCLADAVSICTEWQTLGGRAAIGHGRFTWTWQADLAERWADEAAAYRDLLATNQAKIREALEIPDQPLLVS